MVTANDFLTKFHSLEGITVAEKRKSFNKLLNENDSLLKDPKVSKDITSSLMPVTYLESLFRVEILLIAKHVPELMEILKSGNEALISKIIKDQWFMREAFRDVSAQKIVEEFLPDMSYCVRTKFLKQLVLWLEDEAKLSELFDFYKNKYGLSPALPLLLGCNARKIESVLKNDAVFLTIGQVKTLMRRAPALLPLYVEEYIKHKGDCNYVIEDMSIKKLLFTKYNDIYNILNDKYKLEINYGRRISKKVFEEEKDEILDNPERYAKKINKGVLVRKLGKHGQFKGYFKSLFPKSVKEFPNQSYRIYHILKQFPKNKRYQLLKETYETVYKIRLVDSLKHFDENVFELMSYEDAVERDFIATKLLESTNETDYAVYQKPTKSIPYIKNEINLSTSMSHRRTLIKMLVDTCKVNDDLDSLIEVIKYVSTRHRNDDEVISDFLDHLDDQFDLHTFTKELWQPIMELVDIYSVKNRKHTNFEKILLHFAEFKYIAGEPIKDIVATYTIRDQEGRFFNNHECKNFKFLQKFVDEYISQYPQNNPKADNFTYCALLSKLHDWNMKHREYSISYLKYTKFVESVKDALVAEDCPYSDIWVLVSTKHRNEFIEDVTDLFWENHASEAEIKDVVYFFRWYPTVLLKHKDSFIDAQINGDERLTDVLKWMEKYEHLQFPEQVIEFNKKKFSEEDKVASDLQFHRLFAMLAYFMEPEEFRNYIAPYQPKNLSFEMLEGDDKQIFKIQTDVAKSLNYAKSPIDFLPLVMSYCGGDFLKHVLDSLYKYFHRIPDKSLSPYLEQISKSSVSVRKHALFLTYRIGDIKSINRRLTSMIESETNASVQKRILTTAFRCFLKYRRSEFFELLKISLHFVDPRDKESLMMLADPDYIPKEFRAPFCREVWKVLAEKEIAAKFKQRLKCCVTVQMEKCVDLIPSEFCHEVIQTLFFKFTNTFDYDINEFVLRYLLESQESERFTFIFEILNSAKIHLVEGSEFRSSCIQSMRFFMSDFSDFYFRIGETDKWDKLLLLDFLDKVLNLLPAVEVFADHLKLLLVELLSKSSDLKTYTRKTACLCEEIIQKYSVFIISDIREAISHSLKFFYKNDDSKNATIEFIEELIVFRPTETFYVLGLMILMHSEIDKDDVNKCLENFKSCNYPYVRIYLKRQEIGETHEWNAGDIFS